MKNFFKNLFGKKYPERVDDDVSRTRVVYAGPDYFGRRRSKMQRVYAGPEMMDRERRMASEMEDVYAGPEMPEPEVSDDTEMRCVYAGPPSGFETAKVSEDDVFDEDAGEVTGRIPMSVITGANKSSKNNKAVFNGVYAGPAQTNSGQTGRPGVRQDNYVNTQDGEPDVGQLDYMRNQGVNQGNNSGNTKRNKPNGNKRQG